MGKKYIDFNCDCGESFGLWKMGNDEEILNYVTSANIACGFHGGDPNIMDKTVGICKAKGISVGCHFGYHDLEGFGRREIIMSPQEIANLTWYQLGALDAFCKKHDVKMEHAKIHGSLWSYAARSEEVSRAILDTIRAYDQNMMFIAMPGTVTYKMAHDMGFRVIDEWYADRGTKDNGSIEFKYDLNQIGGSIEAAANRLVRVLEKQKVVSVTGKDIDCNPMSFCIHGDTEIAVELARKVKTKLDVLGYELKPAGQWM